MALPRENHEASLEVVRLWQRVKDSLATERNFMSQMRDQYNGDILIPLPELSRDERPAVANMIKMGIDQMAMRTASVIPQITFPVLGNTDADSRRAENSRRAARGWWDMNAWETLTRYRARHYFAYGSTVVSLSPTSDDFYDKRRIPFWKVRNPLTTYPAPSVNPHTMVPEWCIFSEDKPISVLEKMFPTVLPMVLNADSPIEKVTVLEYVDDHEWVIVLLGANETNRNMYGTLQTTGVRRNAVAMRVPHRIGICPVVIGNRIALDRVEGQYAQALGVFRRQAMLDALQSVAIFRNVFAEQWAVSTSNGASSPRIIKRANAKEGIIGVVDKGNLVEVRPPMGQDISMAIDRDSETIRMYGIPAGMNGLASTNVRTARQGADLISDATDGFLQEAQQMLASCSEQELTIAIRIMKEYHDGPSSFFFGRDGAIPRKEYVPSETFASDIARVKYPLPGTDSAGLTVQLGQMVGAKMLDLETARELDPRIDNPAEVTRRIRVEALENGFMTGLEQSAANGQTDPVTYAKIMKLVKLGKEPVDAVLEVHEEMQKTQASQAQQVAAQPGQVGTNPDVQPGMNVSPENPTVPVAPSNQGPPQLQDLLAMLGGQPGSDPYSKSVPMAPAAPISGV